MSGRMDVYVDINQTRTDDDDYKRESVVEEISFCSFSDSFTRCMWEGLFLLPASVVSIYK